MLKDSKRNPKYGEWILIWWVDSFALFLQVTRIRKISKIYKANLTSRLLPETGRSQSNKPWNMKQTKQTEIHQSQIIKTRTFWTHASKHVFPKRSTKMIDGTEKPKLPSNFAKCTARCNEFRCKRNQRVHQASEIGEFSIYYAEFSD